MIEKLNVEIIRSDRKTLSLEITSDLKVRVRAPRRCSERRIRRFISQRMDWIVKHLMQMEEKQEKLANVKPLTKEELDALVEKAMEVIPQKAANFASILHVTYNRITIRNQQTRWGSCSAKGNLNFNCLLMLTPDEIVDYIVVHELCHRLEMNHSKRFWTLVASVIPDYKRREKWLKENGGLIMARNR